MSITSPTLARCAVALLTLLALRTASAQTQEPCELTELGSLAGSTGDIERVGDLVYAASWTGGLIIYDVSDLENTFVVGELPDCGDPLEISVEGDYAYLTSPSLFATRRSGLGLVVVDVSDPTAPEFVTNVPLTREPSDVFVKDNVAYVLADDLLIFDVSTPADPVHLATAELDASDPERLIVRDQTAYIAADGSLYTVDLTDLAQPTIVVEQRFLPRPTMDIEICDDRHLLFVLSLTGQILVYDITTPFDPVELARANRPGGNPNGMALDGPFVHAFGLRNITTYDFTDPANPGPAQIAFLPAGFAVEGIIENGRGVVAFPDIGLVSMDLQDLTNPVELDTAPVIGLPVQLELTPGVSYVGSDINNRQPRRWNIVDRSETARPTIANVLIGRLLSIEGNIALLDGEVYDLTDPASPVRVGTIDGLPSDITGAIKDNTIKDGYGFIAGNDLLYVADLRAPASAAVVATTPIERFLENLDNRGDLLAVTSQRTENSLTVSTLSLVDIADPLAPSVQSTLTFDADLTSIRFLSDELLVLEERTLSPDLRRLRLINTSDPIQPELVNTIELPAESRFLGFFDGFLALSPARTSTHVLLVDVSTPVSPFVAAEISLPLWGSSLRRSEDGLVHLTNFDEGYLILDLPHCLPALGCPGDIADDFGNLGSPDGSITFGDFLALLTLAGPCENDLPLCLGDIADDLGFAQPDGQVSFGDFLALLTLLGPCP